MLKDMMHRTARSAALLLLTLGCQIVLVSFFLSILGLPLRR